MELKDKIIHASMRLFSMKGFLSTSVQDILAAAKTSKGGLYNHFSSKEALFFAVLHQAQHLWRLKVLAGLDEIDMPLEKLKRILLNYRDRYLKDRRSFPGGCIFVTLSVELDDQRPALSREIVKGFNGFHNLLTRLLEDARAAGQLSPEQDTAALAEMIFAGMLGASVRYGTDKSVERLDQSINALLEYLERLNVGERTATVHPRRQE